jgi:uncharacterized membrane protein
MIGTERTQDMAGGTTTRPSTRWWLRHDAHTVVIEAPAELLYDMVADVPRMGEWSNECQRAEWLEGSDGPAPDARFLGHNRGGPFGLVKWSRQARVIAAEPGREFAFVTEEGGKTDSVRWRYRFEPVEGGTRVTESYEIVWLPAWARIADVPTNRVKELRVSLQHTLAQLKSAAEASPAAG